MTRRTTSFGSGGPRGLLSERTLFAGARRFRCATGRWRSLCIAARGSLRSRSSSRVPSRTRSRPLTCPLLRASYRWLMPVVPRGRPRSTSSTWQRSSSRALPCATLTSLTRASRILACRLPSAAPSRSTLATTATLLSATALTSSRPRTLSCRFAMRFLARSKASWPPCPRSGRFRCRS